MDGAALGSEQLSTSDGNVEQGFFVKELHRVLSDQHDIPLDGLEVLRPCIQVMLETNSANTPCFVPMAHLWEMLSRIRDVVKWLRGSTASPKAILVTGPKGIGKSTLLSKVADPRVFSAIQASIPESRTTCICVDVSARLNQATEYQYSFVTWFLDRVASKLSVDNPGHSRLHQFIQFLLERSKQKEDLSSSDLAFQGASEAHRTWQTEAFIKQLKNISNLTYLTMLNVALAEAKLSVLLLVDDAESIFEGSHFNPLTASSWICGLVEIMELNNVGFVMCASYQRARDLFLPQATKAEFPGKYTHTTLVGSLDHTKLRYLQLHYPHWTTASLTEFILRRYLVLKHANKKIGAYACSDAQCLDSIFAGAVGDGPSDEIPPRVRHENSLERFLAEFGHTPRRIVMALQDAFQSLPFGSEWPMPPAESDKDLIIDVEKAGHVQRTLDAYFFLLEQKLASDSSQTCRVRQLGFDASLFEIRRDELLTRLNLTKRVGISNTTTQDDTATGAGDAHSAVALVDVEAQVSLNTTLDLGTLHHAPNGCLSIGDPSAFARFACKRGSVSSQVLSWLYYVGYGEKAELPVARMLARSELLVRAHKTPAGSTAAMFARAQQHVLVGNAASVSDSDELAGSLSQLHVVALGPQGELLTPSSVRIDDMKPFVQLFQLTFAQKPSHADLWEAIRQAASSRNISMRAIAACIAFQRTHTETLQKLSVRSGGQILKEVPDAVGADLIGINIARADEKMHVQLVRVQVKVAAQFSLQAGPGVKAGNDSISRAVKKFKHTDDLSWHLQACTAIADMFRARLVKLHDVHDVGTWLQRFGKITDSKCTFSFAPPTVVTTHVPKEDVQQRVRDEGFTLLCGNDVASHWGPLGAVCQRLGVLLAPPSAKSGTEEGVRSSRSSSASSDDVSQYIYVDESCGTSGEGLSVDVPAAGVSQPSEPLMD